jgi:hypothetical protein
VNADDGEHAENVPPRSDIANIPGILAGERKQGTTRWMMTQTTNTSGSNPTIAIHLLSLWMIQHIGFPCVAREGEGHDDALLLLIYLP